MAEKKTEQDIKKSVEETVNQILSAGEPSANGGATQKIEDPTAAVTKAMPSSTPANGGEDKIHSGSPMTEEQKAEEAKKAQAAEEAKKAEAAAQAAKEDEAKKAKKDDDDDKDDDKDDKKKKPAFMKKSIAELSAVLDEDELDLIKTWREECEKEAMAKSEAAAPAPIPTQDLAEVLKKAVAEGTADIRKALGEKDTLIKGLQDKIEKMASQPAYDRRSISNLETLEKSGAQASGDVTKAQVLDKMLELQAAGKGVTSHHIAEFEATRNISDPTVRGIVFREFKVN